MACHRGEVADGTTGFDRLADNHLGHAMPTVNCGTYKSAVEKRGLPYRFYGRSSLPFFYVYWPNGWGIQLICSCSDGICPSGGGYDFCNQGIKGVCAYGPCTDKCDDTGECGNCGPNGEIYQEPKVWMYNNDATPSGTHTPATVSWPYYCGKVLYTVYHTHSGFDTPYRLLLQEKIMMYLIMEIQTCSSGPIVR